MEQRERGDNRNRKVPFSIWWQSDILKDLAVSLLMRKRGEQYSHYSKKSHYVNYILYIYGESQTSTNMLEITTAEYIQIIAAGIYATAYFLLL
jgi:hypothetical protein